MSVNLLQIIDRTFQCTPEVDTMIINRTSPTTSLRPTQLLKVLVLSASMCEDASLTVQLHPEAYCVLLAYLLYVFLMSSCRELCQYVFGT